jgi:hypothetical protein
MDVTDEQKAQIRQWATDGATLAEIQERLRKELGIALNYMETRLLVSDLNVSLQEKQKISTNIDLAQLGTKPASAAASAPPSPAPAGAPGKLQVTIDDIAPPHALVSGKVTFSDGTRAEWYLDELGRLAINPPVPGYRPSQADLSAFQRELQRLAQGRGL